jgi:hypothetical protein
MIPVMNADAHESIPDVSTAAAMLEAAIGQIRFARDYTRSLLDTAPPGCWFEIPPGLPSNLAWQIGHLTVSQYGLLMFRIRGRQPDDLELIPGRFRKAYSRGSTPSDDPANQPSVDEFIERLDRVNEISMRELAELDPAVLLEPVGMPYAVFPIKLGAILFCPLHEHIHAGQIGMIRRSLGMAPIR